MKDSTVLTSAVAVGGSILLIGFGFWLGRLSNGADAPSTIAAYTPPPSPQAPIARSQTWAVGNSYPKVAPFSSIRWRDTTPEVQVNGVWYQWLALDDQTAAQIVDAAMKLDRRSWQKRVNEDLVELLAQMGHETGPTVSLQLRNLETSEAVTLQNVPMTEENRRAIWTQTNQSLVNRR